MAQGLWYLLLALSLFAYSSSGLLFDVTNLQCTSKDANFLNFSDCIYKAVNRSYKYVTIRATLAKPLGNCKLAFAILKRANGYKPFLYNQTVDLCDFMRNRKRYPVIKLIYSLLADYTNVNHTCPLKEPEVVIEKIDLYRKTKQLISVLPLPVGEYAIHTIWMTNGLQFATIRGYGRLY